MTTFQLPSFRAVLVPMMVLAACGGSNPSPTTDAGTPPTPGACVGGGGSTVVGQVVDTFGQPISGRTVVLSGHTVTTGADGCFTFTAVSFPYDVSVLRTDSSPKVATVYSQLTRTDPTLRDYSAIGAPARSGSLTGTLVGTFPGPAGTTTAVSFASPETSFGNYVTSLPWSLNVGWPGGTSTTGNLHALQWTTDANGTLTAVVSHGVRSGVTLNAGGTTANADVTLAPLTATGVVSGTIGLPTGYTLSSRTAYLTFADGAGFPVSDDALTSTSFALPIPTTIGASVLYTVAADDGLSQESRAQISGLAPGTSGVVLSVPAAAVATAPATGATGVDTTTPFTWTPVPGSVTVLILTGQGTDPLFYLVTGGSSTHLPDLSGQGLGLGAGRTYDWAVVGIGPYASVDALTATARLDLGFQTVSGGYQFTTR